MPISGCGDPAGRLITVSRGPLRERERAQVRGRSRGPTGGFRRARLQELRGRPAPSCGHGRTAERRSRHAARRPRPRVGLADRLRVDLARGLRRGGLASPVGCQLEVASKKGGRVLMAKALRPPLRVSSASWRLDASSLKGCASRASGCSAAGWPWARRDRPEARAPLLNLRGLRGFRLDLLGLARRGLRGGVVAARLEGHLGARARCLEGDCAAWLLGLPIRPSFRALPGDADLASSPRWRASDLGSPSSAHSSAATSERPLNLEEIDLGTSSSPGGLSFRRCPLLGGCAPSGLW